MQQQTHLEGDLLLALDCQNTAALELACLQMCRLVGVAL